MRTEDRIGALEELLNERWDLNEIK
jgi:hypothetical protein